MGLLDNIGTGAIGAGMGMITGEMAKNRAEEMNQEYIHQQEASARRMGNFNYQNQMKMWRETNYSAQVEQMRKAGLSIGNMYGGSGAGGSTNANPASSGSGGAGAGRNDELAGIGMVLQNQNMEANKELIKAQTENVKADTETKGLTNKWEKFLQGADNNEGTDGTPLKERTYRLENNQRIAQIAKLDGELQKMGVDMRKGESEIERIKQDTALQAQLKKYRDEMNPMELERYKKELELLNENPENNEVVRWIRTILGIGGDLTKIVK